MEYALSVAGPKAFIPYRECLLRIALCVEQGTLTGEVCRTLHATCLFRDYSYLKTAETPKSQRAPFVTLSQSVLIFEAELATQGVIVS